MKSDIKNLIFSQFDEWVKMAGQTWYNELDITIATNDNGERWGYQTGDNSFTGGAYGLPHWVVVTVTKHSTDKEALYEEVINQFEDLINQ